MLVTKDERHKRRMVVDYSQTINRFTVVDAYPLPKIDEQVNNLAQCSWFSPLDLKSAYYQISINPEDKIYTAFEANGKLYQYWRLPFDGTNGVSAFQRIIDRLISQNKLKGTYAYLDNITIGGTDRRDHDINLERFLLAAARVCLTFNEAKSVIAAPQIDILGCRVSHGTIKPDPERLHPLLELPLPSSPKELKRALGMFAYYAPWIRNFSAKLKPLTAERLTFPLRNDAVKAFEDLRSGLLHASLACINDHESFTVECDASDFAVAAILNQSGRLVAFMSRRLSRTECKCPTVEKEATSIWKQSANGVIICTPVLLR